METILKVLALALFMLILASLLFPHMFESFTHVTVSAGRKPVIFSGNVSSLSISMKIPAVDSEGNGVVTRLKVEEKPGEGRVLVDINQLLFWIDTQESIRVAQRVAQNYTQLDLSKVDLIYAIEANASVIGGPSAGAALTIATIALLENKTLRQDVMITGTIEPDGSIGPVGGIIAKAEAAKEAGIKLFLVPEGQAVQTYFKPVEHCERFGPITYCRTEYKAERINVSEKVGIEVKEVENVGEALDYFLS